MSAGAVPLVSVVTPCHNAAPFVAETLECVLAQTHPAVEHVVVDDGSTDGGWEIIERFAAEHPGRVHALRLEGNRGGCHARNRGAELARGEFLLFLDADDLVSPDAVAAMVDAARGAPDTIGTCDWRRLRLEGDRWVEAPADVPYPPRDPDHLRGWLGGPGWVPTCSMLWPRALYERTGGWDEEVAINQDGDLVLRALAGGARLVPGSAGVSYYRVAPGTRASVSRTGASERKLRSHLRVLERVGSILQGQGRLEAYREALGLAYHTAALAGFRDGQPELARECLRRGRALAGRRALSPTFAGRVLVWLLGMERKERLVQWLARMGIATPSRRGVMRFMRAHAHRAAGGAP